METLGQHSVYWGIDPAPTPLFLAKPPPPPLNLQNVQAPSF